MSVPTTSGAPERGGRRREPVRQLLGEEHLTPAIDRAIGGRPQNEVEPQVEPEGLGRHPQGVLAQRHAPRQPARLPQAAPDDDVDDVAYAGRAVVQEVVVLVSAVLGTGVLLQPLLQLSALLGRQIETLGRDAPVLALVPGQHARQRRHRQPVGEAPAEEVEDQPRRIERERSEVVDPVGAGRGVVHPERVVPELEERVIARPEGQGVGGEPRLIGALVLRRCPGAGCRRGHDQRDGGGKQRSRHHQNLPHVTARVATPRRRNRRYLDGAETAAKSCRRPGARPAPAPRSP